MALKDTIQKKFDAVIEAIVTGASTLAEKLLGFFNRSIYNRVQWIATLDNKTCPRCGALSGKIWKLDANSLFTHPVPPRHPRCRCRLSLIRRFKKPPKEPTFEEWLKEQDTETVQEVLGKKKAQLFIEGGLKLDQFVDDTGEELNLAELRQRESEAWKRAGF